MLERDIQVMIASVLRLAGVFFWHTPNGGLRDPIVAAKMKEEGVLPGVSDIIIADRPPTNPEYIGLIMELKTKKGVLTKTKKGVLTENQIDYLNKMSDRGWACHVCYGLDDALFVLRKYKYIS